jgi:N-methylhydantoinase A/oxoprolinase/acetone carboxylase beta subunit
MVAPHAGVLSALGMTVAVPGRREVHSILENLSQINWHKIEQLADQLISANQTALAMELEDGQELAHRCLLGFRYQGQQSVLQLPWDVLQEGALQQQGNGQQDGNWEDLFHSEHQNRYGYRLEREIEVVDITLISEVVNSDSSDRRLGLGISDTMTTARPETVSVWSQGKYIQACLLRRECLTGQQLRGPMVIAGSDTTIWVPELWAGYQDEDGMLILKRLAT